MALSEKTVNAHNLKRAEVFKANGLCDMDVAFAHPVFSGYSDTDVDCGLCGHRHIKWLYAIRFDKPDPMTALAKVFAEITRTAEVTLAPVGSKCIQDWLDAVPESAAKLEALKRWAAALEVANKAKRAKLLENKIKKLGYADEAALSARASEILAKLGKLGEGTFKALRDKVGWANYQAFKKLEYRSRTKAGLGYAKHAETLHDLCVRLDAELTSLPAPKTLTETEQLVADGLDEKTAKLVVRGRNVFRAGLDKNLSGFERDALADIGKKLVYYKKFASARQGAFFENLLEKAEGAAAGTTKPPTLVALVPAASGSTGYVSPSGIDGARY